MSLFNLIQNYFFQITFKITYFKYNSNILHLYSTALYLAVKKENIEIIKLLLTNDKLDINILSILKYIIYSDIENLIFKCNSKL